MCRMVHKAAGIINSINPPQSNVYISGYMPTEAHSLGNDSFSSSADGIQKSAASTVPVGLHEAGPEGHHLR